MKKLLVFLIIAALLLPGMGMAESADFKYERNGGQITGYSGAGGAVAVPSEINGQPVYSLQWGMFNNTPDVTAVSLPDTLQALGSNVLFSCAGLTELTIPASVAFIDSGCFSWNDNLKSVTFLGAVPRFGGEVFSVTNPELVVYVPDDQVDAYRAALPEDVTVSASGQNAVAVDHTAAESDFYFDPATGTITGYIGTAGYLKIPAQIGGVAVKAIGEDVFYNRRGLYYVELPEGLETIGNTAFKYCNEMHAASLPDSLRVIGDEAFCSAWTAQNIELPKGLEKIGAGAFAYAHISELHLNGLGVEIGERAFENSWLQEAYMDDSGIVIGSNAFSKSYLNYLCIDAYRLMPGLAADAFAGTSRLEDLDLPWDCSYENQQAWRVFMAEQAPNCYVWINNPTDCSYPSNSNATYAEYPDGTLYLAAYTGSAESLQMYHTMDGVQITGLGEGVFRGNQTLKKYRVTHSDQFAAIGADAFADSAVEVVDLYHTTETIGAGAFRNCVNLREITLPASLKTIGAEAFAGCANLEKVTVNCDPALLEAGMFADCPKLNVAALLGLTEMPHAATPEGDFEFDAATGTITGYRGTAADVVIPRAIGGVPVTAIGYNAFERCRDYTDTDMATNQTTWQPLRSVVIPETVTAVADSAFSYCQQLELVICYAPLKSTGRGAFLLCRSLKDVVFVNGVNEIDNYAFESTTALERVYWGDHLRRIGVNAFNRCGLERVVIDAEVVDEGAFNHCDALRDVTLTGRVREIHAAAFSYCTQLYNFACAFSEAERFVDGGPTGGIPEAGVTTIFPETTTPEQLSALNGKLNIWNGGHLGSGNEITLAPVTYETAQKPDADALYQAVVSQPAPEAHTEPEAPAVLPDPIADMSQVLGDWTLETMVSGGEEIDPAVFGMAMTLTLNADGTAAMGMGDEIQPLAWHREEGVLFIGSGAGDDLPVGYADGMLRILEGGDEMVFARAETGSAPAPAAGNEALASYVGTWYAIKIDAGIAPVAAQGLDIVLTLNADGTGSFTFDGSSAPFTVEEGQAYYGDMPITLREDGRLMYGSPLSGAIYFSKDPGDVMPDEAMATPEPVATQAPAPAAQPAGDLVMDAKYLARTYDAAGYTLDAAMLGAEYSITLHADGTCDFIVNGSGLPGMRWEKTEGGVHFDYMGALTYDAVLDGAVIKLDFGGMIMNYEQ